MWPLGTLEGASPPSPTPPRLPPLARVGRVLFLETGYCVVSSISVRSVPFRDPEASLLPLNLSRHPVAPSPRRPVAPSTDLYLCGTSYTGLGLLRVFLESDDFKTRVSMDLEHPSH